MLARAVVLIVPLALMATGCRGTPKAVIVLKAVEPGVTKRQLEEAATIMRNRLVRLGIRSATVRREQGNRVLIELPRRFVSAPSQHAVVKTGFLGFYDFEADLAGPSKDDSGNFVAMTSLFGLLEAVHTQAEKATPTAFYLFDSRRRLLAGPEQTRKGLLAEARARRVSNGHTVMAVPADRTMISCRASTGCPGVQQGQSAPTFYYLFRYRPDNPIHQIPEATGADLKLSAIQADVGAQPGQGTAVVRVAFTAKGAKKFHEITRAEAARGQAAANAAGQGGASDINTITRFAQHFAIVLDGELRSTPYIDYKQNPDGIDPSGTGAEISNINSSSEAKNLALVLQTGALPVHFIRVR